MDSPKDLIESYYVKPSDAIEGWRLTKEQTDSCEYEEMVTAYCHERVTGDYRMQLERLQAEVAALKERLEAIKALADKQRGDARYYGGDYTASMREADLRQLHAAIDAALARGGV